MRAIVVDDSRAMRVVLGRILKQIGFDVAEAAHGKEALQEIDSNGKVDLMLVVAIRKREELADMRLRSSPTCG